MFISRKQAERKYKISNTRLRQLEREGKLKALDASMVGYEQPKKRRRGGPPVRVVYDEAYIAAHVGKPGADVRFVRKQRRDARVFDVLEQGIDVPTIVMKLRFELAIVKRLRDEYVEEKKGFGFRAKYADLHGKRATRSARTTSSASWFNSSRPGEAAQHPRPIDCRG